MGGLHTNAKVEIEFTNGSFTDVTAYVAGEVEMGGSRLRATEFDDTSAGTWQVTFRNDDGRFTPDNPLSPYWPNVVESIRMRVSIIKGASTYQRFVGYISAWEPNFNDGDGYRGQVVVSAADAISVLQQRTLYSDYIEQERAKGPANSTWIDVYPLTQTNNVTATSFSNLGNTIGSQALGTATMVPHKSGIGAFQVGTDDTVTLEGIVTMQPSSGVGYVLKVKPQAGTSLGYFDFWLKVPTGTLPGAGTYGVCDLWSGTNALGSLRLRNNGGSCNLALYDKTSTLIGDLYTGIATNTWFRVNVQPNVTPTLSDVSVAWIDGTGGVWAFQSM